MIVIGGGRVGAGYPDPLLTLMPCSYSHCMTTTSPKFPQLNLCVYHDIRRFCSGLHVTIKVHRSPDATKVALLHSSESNADIRSNKYTVSRIKKVEIFFLNINRGDMASTKSNDSRPLNSGEADKTGLKHRINAARM